MPKRRHAKKVKKTPKKRFARARTVYRSVRRRVSRGTSRGGMRGFGPVIAGLAGGAARAIGNKFLPGWGAPLGEGAVGYFLKNPTAMYMAGRDLGGSLAGGFLGGSSGISLAAFQ